MHSKVMKVLVKSLKNVAERHDKVVKTSLNACIKFKRALATLNLDYFINYSSFCDEREHL